MYIRSLEPYASTKYKNETGINRPCNYVTKFLLDFDIVLLQQTSLLSNINRLKHSPLHSNSSCMLCILWSELKLCVLTLVAYFYTVVLSPLTLWSKTINYANSSKLLV
jgi:hypothetical protein